MAVQINLDEARSQLSALVDRAAAGEEIVIAKNGKPRARLVPMPKRAGKRRLGHLAGKLLLGPEVDEPLDSSLFGAEAPPLP